MKPFSFASALLLGYMSPSKGGNMSIEETWRDYLMVFYFCLFLCFFLLLFFFVCVCGTMKEQKEVEMGSEKFSAV